MPSTNTVSYNSSRVQRAYRINNIETLKLNHRLQLLEKERMHKQRLTNQDIRLISLTLDYIQTCSGNSQEGLAPDETAEEVDEQRQQEQGPCFLYGERIVSRKKRRNLRPQSAMDVKSSSALSSETASIASANDFALRPQSSPSRRKPPFITQFRDDVSEYGNNAESAPSGESTPRYRPSWPDDPPSEVTKILLKAAADSNKGPVPVFERTRDSFGKGSAHKTISRSLRISSNTRLSQSQPSIKNVDDAAPFPTGRGASITDILSGGQTSMSAAAWKTSLSHRHSGPITSSMQRKQIMDTKKAWNNETKEFVQKKVYRFINT